MIRSYREYLHALHAHESRGTGNYQARNPYGYLGRYQLGKLALQDAGYMNKQGWVGRHGIWNEEDFMNHPLVQENAVRIYHARAWRIIQNEGWDHYVGQIFNGVEITPYGLLAAYHLKGNALRAYLESGGVIDPTDANRTPVSKYFNELAGYGDFPTTIGLGLPEEAYHSLYTLFDSNIFDINAFGANTDTLPDLLNGFSTDFNRTAFSTNGGLDYNWTAFSPQFPGVDYNMTAFSTTPGLDFNWTVFSGTGGGATASPFDLTSSFSTRSFFDFD